MDDITLCEINKNDIEIIRLWRNKKNIRKCFINNEIISSKQQINWYKNYSFKNNDIMFIIKYLGKPIGCVALYNINNKKAEFGRLIIGDDINRGKGLALRASYMLCKYGFNKLNLEMIYLSVFKNNKKAINLYIKLGFKIVDNDNLLKMELYKNNLKMIGE